MEKIYNASITSSLQPTVKIFLNNELFIDQILPFVENKLTFTYIPKEKNNILVNNLSKTPIFFNDKKIDSNSSLTLEI